MEMELTPGRAWAGEMQAGEILRLTATSGASLVCFNRADLTERFDQARTKVYNMKLWLEPGDKLFSKLNNPMMRVVADGFAPTGRHDLQLGMCQSCAAGLAEALAPWKIAAHVIPMPLNAFMHADIDTASGAIVPTSIRPAAPATLELAAEMDLVVAVAACPDERAAGGARTVGVALARW